MVRVEEATALWDPSKIAIAWTVDLAAIEIAPHRIVKSSLASFCLLCNGWCFRGRVTDGHFLVRFGTLWLQGPLEDLCYTTIAGTGDRRWVCCLVPDSQSRRLLSSLA